MTPWNAKVKKLQKRLQLFEEKFLTFFDPSVGGIVLRDIFHSWRTLKPTPRFLIKCFIFIYVIVAVISLLAVSTYMPNEFLDLKSVSTMGQIVIGFGMFLTQITIVLRNTEGFEEIFSTINDKCWSINCAGLTKKKEFQRDGFYTALPISMYVIAAIAILFIGVITMVDHKFSPLLILPDLETPYFELVHSLIYLIIIIALLPLSWVELVISFVCWSISVQFEMLGDYFQSTVKEIEYCEMSFKEKKCAEQRLIMNFVEQHNLVVGACNRMKSILWIGGTMIWFHALLLFIYDFALLSLIPGHTWWFTIPFFYVTYVHFEWGTSIHTKSEALAEVIYCSDWYLSQNISFKKSLLIILMRLQKPDCLSFSGFAVIHVEHFLNMVKIAYSVCTVLVFAMKKFQ